jgi:hypothetical protein
MRMTPKMQSDLLFMLRQVNYTTFRIKLTPVRAAQRSNARCPAIDQLRKEDFKRHADWFSKNYLKTGNQTIDIIRYVCCAYHPSNEVHPIDMP